MDYEKCSFCYELLRPTDEVYITNCRHKFHHFCIHCCLDHSKTCYKCGKDVNRNEIVRVQFTGDLHRRSDNPRFEMQLRSENVRAMSVEEVKEEAIRKPRRDISNESDTASSNEIRFNIICIICFDSFTQTDDVYATMCGHMFHYGCLYQWLKQSETCPQCRKPCILSNTIKVYCNPGKVDMSQSDIEALKEQLKDANRENLKTKERLRMAEEYIDQMTTMPGQKKTKTAKGRKFWN